MKRKSWSAMLLLLLLGTACTSKTYEELTQVEGFLKKSHVRGTFVLYDGKTFHVANMAQAKERVTPASTFKIANALIILHVGAVSSVHEVFFHYDGTPYSMKTWEQDMDLAQAIATSNVKAFQQLARKVGVNRMQKEIQALHYGNEQIGSVVDRFWLDGPLAISAIEQTKFLMNLAEEKLPCPVQIQRDVKGIILLEDTPQYQLYGKTGLLTKPHAMPIGWFIGFVKEKSSDQMYTFAFHRNMTDISPRSLLEGRVELTKAILRDLKVLP